MDTRPPEESSAQTPPPPSRQGVGWFVAVLLAVVVGGALSWWFTHRRPVAQPVDAGVPEVAAVDAGPGLPPVQDSDALLRGELAGVGSDPAWLAWLDEKDLARRFVSAVSLIAEGDSPRPVLPFLAPGGSFKASEREGVTFVDPRSYARYDKVAQVVDSLDAARAGAAYRALRPLLDQAYQEIAPPGAKLDAVLARAMDRLLAVPVPEGDVELVSKGLVYTFADPTLEERSAAEKHLLRMGPENQRKVQAKLRELRAAL